MKLTRRFTRLTHIITGHTWECRDCWEVRYHQHPSSGRQICRCGATRMKPAIATHQFTA